MSVLFFSVLSVGTVSGTDSGLSGGAEKGDSFLCRTAEGETSDLGLYWRRYSDNVIGRTDGGVVTESV